MIEIDLMDWLLSLSFNELLLFIIILYTVAGILWLFLSWIENSLPTPQYKNEGVRNNDRTSNL